MKVELLIAGRMTASAAIWRQGEDPESRLTITQAPRSSSAPTSPTSPPVSRTAAG